MKLIRIYTDKTSLVIWLDIDSSRQEYFFSGYQHRWEFCAEFRWNTK